MIVGRLLIVNCKPKAYQSPLILGKQKYYRDYKATKPSKTDKIEETKKIKKRLNMSVPLYV